jgi:hypothetical protein
MSTTHAAHTPVHLGALFDLGVRSIWQCRCEVALSQLRGNRLKLKIACDTDKASLIKALYCGSVLDFAQHVLDWASNRHIRW